MATQRSERPKTVVSRISFRFISLLFSAGATLRADAKVIKLLHKRAWRGRLFYALFRYGSACGERGAGQKGDVPRIVPRGAIDRAVPATYLCNVIRPVAA